jgi:hypothetical protein
MLQISNRGGSQALKAAFVTIFVVFCLCYVFFPQVRCPFPLFLLAPCTHASSLQYYWVFIVTYSLQVAMFFYRAFSLIPKPSTRATLAQKWQAHLYKCAALVYLGGWAFLWMPENLFCLKYPSVFQPLHLHAFFHLTSAVAPFYVLMFLSFAREEARRGVGKVKHEQQPLFFLGAIVVPDGKGQ